MTKIDRMLVAFLGLGVWALVATTIFKTTPVVAEEQRSRYEIESIVEDCSIYGEVSDGEIDGGGISC